MFRAQAAALTDTGGFDLIVPDLPGHGAAPPGFTLERAVAQVRDLLAESDRPAHLVGVSMSATIALLVALSDPARVKSLLVSGATIRPSRTVVNIQRGVTAMLPIRVSAQLSAKIVASADVRDREALKSDVMRAGKKTHLQVLRELVNTDLASRIAQVNVPTLVCCGARDTVNLPSAQLISRSIPGATLNVVPGSGHLWNLQHPDQFTKTIAEFVSAHES